MRSLILALLIFLAVPATAGTLELDGDFVQGGMVLGRTDPGAEVRVGERQARVAPDGRFVFGFGRDHKPEIELQVRFPDGTAERRVLKVAKREYRVQRIDGLPPRKVTPSAEDMKRIRADNAKIGKVRKLDTPEVNFADGWAWPAEGRVTGVYGSQRILNGEPRRPHFGHDIAAPVGTPVVAPAPGIVRLAETDLFFTGGTIILDHGHGISSLYMHLSAVEVAVGRRVQRGERIGAIGATGRVTGPHLDWRINWFGERLDPELLLEPKPSG